MKWRKKLVYLLCLITLGVFTFLNTQLKVEDFSTLTFKNTEALAGGGEGGDYFDNHEDLPDEQKKCTIDGKIPGIWIDCASGNQTCFSGCEEVKNPIL